MSKPSRSSTTCRTSGRTSRSTKSLKGLTLTDGHQLRILGIDPGSRYTGYGMVERSGKRRLATICHGRIALPPGDELASRLALLANEIDHLVASYRPDIVALESLFRGVNVKSLIVLAQARGVILAGLARAGVQIREYSPTEVKSAVTGSGRADKQQVARMVRLILGLGETKLAPDASDALALGICLAQRLRLDDLARPQSSAKPT